MIDWEQIANQASALTTVDVGGKEKIVCGWEGGGLNRYSSTALVSIMIRSLPTL